MIIEILRGARWLDRKLEDTIGRPYRVLISAALIAEIAAQVRSLTLASFSRAHFVQTLVWIVIGALVVINQMGELSNRMEHRQARQSGSISAPSEKAAEGPATRIRGPRH